MNTRKQQVRVFLAPSEEPCYEFDGIADHLRIDTGSDMQDLEALDLESEAVRYGDEAELQGEHLVQHIFISLKLHDAS